MMNICDQERIRSTPWSKFGSWKWGRNACRKAPYTTLRRPHQHGSARCKL